MVVKTDMILYYSDFEQTVVVKTDMILYYSDFERLTNRGSKDWYDFILQWFWTNRGSKDWYDFILQWFWTSNKPW